MPRAEVVFGVLLPVSLLVGRGEGRPGRKEAEENARRHTHALVDLAGRDTFEVYSARRQILRNLEWFGKLPSKSPEGLAELGAPAVALAKDIFEKLPEEGQDKWK